MKLSQLVSNISEVKASIFQRNYVDNFEKKLGKATINGACNGEAYDLERNVISVNRNNFDDSYKIVNSISHETRHIYQLKSTKF